MTPEEFTNQEFYLDVGDGHRVYVQDWGNAKAKLPILYLHGGPGNGCNDRYKQEFDPTAQRVIFHDQRGAGQSLPAGSLEHNTTHDLVEDIEKIARRLELKQFVLVGGSWGSTLALCYGIAHPKRVRAMVLNGIFTATQAEFDWLAQGGWRRFFPEIWREYLDRTPPEHHKNPMAYHLRQVSGPDKEAAKKSAYAYESMELALLKLDEVYKPASYETYEPSKILIEMHYDANRFFLDDGYIIKNAARLTMPIHLIVGRYDMVTPPGNADDLCRALPDSRMYWTINGHLRQHEAKSIERLLLNSVTGGS